jgi:hypothetical protein
MRSDEWRSALRVVLRFMVVVVLVTVPTETVLILGVMGLAHVLDVGVVAAMALGATAGIVGVIPGVVAASVVVRVP